MANLGAKGVMKITVGDKISRKRKAIRGWRDCSAESDGSSGLKKRVHKDVWVAISEIAVQFFFLQCLCR